MLDPPFLELQYYAGRPGPDGVISQLVNGMKPGVVPAKLAIPQIVGLSQKPEEVEVIGRIVVLRTEGEAFCGRSRDDRARLRKLGRKAYQRFVEVADTISSVYGAILVEYSLEEPAALRKDPRSLAFRDFFLSRENLDQAAVDEAISLSGDNAYIEQSRRGVYISMSAEFNPKRHSIPPFEAQERSARISAVIGRVAR